ncbi:helix-turn-helix domain-containing protein [Neobacillus sp. 179-J 1A1 HS]|uniref:helix-turn-helix domain-containing protein n=1 Tax=Neobacillus driksii TaxID=3035913 RepID=UPI0035BC62F5
MTSLTIVSTKQDIFNHGNKHQQEKLRAFGDQGKVVIKYILSKMLKYPQFFESNKTIASEVGCSIRTVQNAIRKAEQLNIFAVSPRKELDELTGKTRQTTNLIQLLAYAPLKKVKKVIVEAVREVKNKVETVAQKVSNAITTKREKNVQTSQNKAQNSGQKWSKKAPIRTEILPDWWEESTIEIKKKNSLQQDQKPSITKEMILKRLRMAGF